MIKNVSVFIAILLTVSFALAQSQPISVTHIGYDGLSPIFASIGWDRGKASGHNGIYKYADGRLTKTDVPIRKDVWYFKVKNGIYVSGYGEHPVKLQVYRNGRVLLFEYAIKWPTNLYWYTVSMRITMNDEELFTIADVLNRKDDTTSIIFRTKYRSYAPVDTIKVKGRCTNLLEATNDHLYYTIQYPADPDCDCDYLPQDCSIYRMSLMDGSVDEIVKDVGTEYAKEIAFALQHSVVFASGKLVDYNKNTTIWTGKSHFTEDLSVFFSYEHNAFVMYKASSNVSEWDCYHLATDGKLPTKIEAVPCFKEIKRTK
jgi:hypothetical protein